MSNSNSNNNIFDGFPKLRPLQSAEELAKLQDAAKADGHRVIGATHLIVKGGEIVGYASLAGVPLLNVWLDSKRVQARDSLLLLREAEAILADRGNGGVIMPCAAGSPFKPAMARFGYEELGNTVLHIKVF